MPESISLVSTGLSSSAPPAVSLPRLTGLEDDAFSFVEGFSLEAPPELLLPRPTVSELADEDGVAEGWAAAVVAGGATGVEEGEGDDVGLLLLLLPELE